MQALAQPYLLGRDEGTPYWFFGSLLMLKDTAQASNGQITWIEQVCPPMDSPYHIHHDEDELFQVLEGEMSFVSGNTAWKAGPGSFVFLPRGVPHGFRVEGNQPARSLLITTSGHFEQFVRELGQPTTELVIPPPGPIDMAAVIAAAARHNLTILGPLPDYTV